ncbi:MAG: hypothetical protein E7631_01605 [Ruminococcaceae bacterium]|nr:hypothetical protein [Oscillospiraceae bacterium]
MNNNTSGKRLSKEEAMTVVTFRVLIILLADIIIGSLLDFVRADSTREFTFVFSVCPWLTWVFGAVCAVSLGYFVWSLVKKVDTRRYYMTPAMLFALCLFLFAVVLLYKYLTMMMIVSAMVIASVLFAVYYIYTNLLY